MLKVEVDFKSSVCCGDHPEERMKIGELARCAGCNASAIRFYEKRGLLAAPYRTGGQRRYSQDALDRVLLVGFASAMGFTLARLSFFSTACGKTPHRVLVGKDWRSGRSRKSKKIFVARAA
jgi:hypothetical protein